MWLCSAGLLSSLVHTRAGIPDAMLAVGALSVLTDRLMNDSNETVRRACAVTLGYLTYNRTASRFLFAACRNRPALYDQLIAVLGPSGKINAVFVDDFQCALKVGLPCMRYSIVSLASHLVIVMQYFKLIIYYYKASLARTIMDRSSCLSSVCPVLALNSRTNKLLALFLLS